MSEPIDRTISRRMFVARGGGAALLATSAGGCSFFSTDPNVQEGRNAGDTGALESPMLAERVQAGDLEHLDERLPSNPLVVDVPQPGRYGGTWRGVTLGPGDEAALQRVVGYQPLLRKNPMLTETVPNLCTDIETAADGRTFTLRLREGLRWSDGEPFGADDVLFAAEEVLQNEELGEGTSGYLNQAEKPATVEKLDDTTVAIGFSEPNGTFKEMSARVLDLVRFPKHYVSQFLPAHNGAVEQDARDNGFETWTDYFDDAAGWSAPWHNPDLPVLNPWRIVEPLSSGGRVTLERNPYFWKTDPDGRQLPYIDTLSFEVVLDPEVMVLKGTSGEVDLIYRHVNNPQNKPVFARSREQGDYDLVENRTTLMNTTCFALNLANKDAAHRELYQNKDFRIGLSHAIDREELITAVWQRQGEPWQVAPTADSIFYDEEFAKQYTEFDVALASEHLDAAGLTERDAEGFRKLPNGDSLTITVDIATAMFEEWPAAADMIKTMWADVGIRLKLNTIDRTLFVDRRLWDTNEHDAGIWAGDGGFSDEIDYGYWYLPLNSGGTMWATPWAQWFNSRGTSGEEPVAPAKKQIELYWELQRTPDPAAREDIFRQILSIAKEEFWVLGIGTAPNPYLVVKNRLKNVVGGVPDTYIYFTPAHTNPEMWYLDDDA